MIQRQVVDICEHVNLFDSGINSLWRTSSYVEKEKNIFVIESRNRTRLEFLTFLKLSVDKN